MKITKIEAIWCSGCLVMKKVWKEVAKEYPNIEITTYDYDMDPEMVQKYNVGTILPVIIFQNGNEEKRLIGERTKDEVVNVIKEMQ